MLNRTDTSARVARTLLPFGMVAGADLTGRLLAFLTLPIITRHFGDAAFGDLGVANQMMMFALLVGTCGLDVFSVRTVARTPHSVGQWVTTVMLLRLALGVVAYLALLAVASVLPQYHHVFSLVAVFGLSLFTRAVYLDWAAQALQDTRTLATAMLGVQVLYLGLIVASVTAGGAVWTIAAAQIMAEACVALAVLVWFRHRIDIQRPLPPREWPGVLGQSLPFAGSQLLRGVSLGLDLVLLGFFVVPREVIGWYTGAFKFYQLATGTVAAYFLIMLPRLSSSAAVSVAAMRHELRHSLRLIVPLATLAAVGVGLGAKALLRALGGTSRFEQAAPALQILLIAVLAGLIAAHFRNALFALGRQHADLRNVSASSVAHVGLKLALIPSLGIVGVAIGTAGGELLLAVLGWITLRRLSGSPEDDVICAPGMSSLGGRGTQ